MIERAVLWVAHPKLLELSAGGMGVLERQLFCLARAGLKQAWIGSHELGPGLLGRLRMPAGLEVRWAGGDGLASCPPPYLGVSTDHFVRVDALKKIASEPHAESVSYDDASGLGVVQVVLRRDESLSRLRVPLPADAAIRLEAPLDGDAVTDWLMRVCIKDADGFMARHFDRHVSMAVSRALLPTPVTPNAMTLASTALGLAGAALFAAGVKPAFVAGSVMVWLHSVLDGCDGELARVKFLESPFGSDLDFWGDNLVHVALFSCMGFGLSKAGHGPLAAGLGLAAAAASAASAWNAWGHRLARRAGGGPEAGVLEEKAFGGTRARLVRLQNALAQRDFLYALVLLAFLDLLYPFLWASALGSLAYLAVMMYLRRVNQHEQAQPHPAR